MAEGEVQPAATEQAVATPAVQPAEPPAVQPGGLGAEAGKPEQTTQVEPKLWPDDWRERWASNDEKELSRLRRFKSPDNVYRSLRSMESKLSSGFYQPVIGEGATDQEVAEYRQSHGIPEEPSAEGYGVNWPEGYEPSEADKADLGAFLEQMHGSHMPASTVQKVWQSYIALQANAAEELQVAAQQKTEEYRAQVRARYMNEKGRFDRATFERDARIGNNYLSEFLGDERSQEITQLTLADGTKLGDHPLFWELFTSAALKTADDNALFTTPDHTGSVGTVDDQFQRAIDLQFTDARAYHSTEHQQKLQRLAAAIAKRKPQAA